MPSLELSLQAGGFSLDKPRDVTLEWDDTLVRLSYSKPAIEGEPLEIFSVNPSSIQESLLADGSTTVYLTVGQKKYQIAVDLFEPAQQIISSIQHPNGAFVADSVIEEVGETNDKKARLKEFQDFLTGHGVKTSRTNLVKIVALTVIGFFIALALLIAVVLGTYAKK